MAIPKIIHYCWLSGEPFPELVRKCMDSWKVHLPDYEFIFWNLPKIKQINNAWIESAVAAKKWAFAADYVRLYALYNYGGIYLDCDVEVVKSFDDLLNRPYFLGRESHKNVIEAAVMGAECQMSWIGKSLDWYNGKKFDAKQINNPSIAIPVILKNVLEKHRDVAVFPAEYFSPKDNRTGKLSLTKNSYTIHHFDGNWFSDYQREYFRIRVAYSRKYGSIAGLLIATLFSLKRKLNLCDKLST